MVAFRPISEPGRALSVLEETIFLHLGHHLDCVISSDTVVFSSGGERHDACLIHFAVSIENKSVPGRSTDNNNNVMASSVKAQESAQSKFGWTSLILQITFLVLFFLLVRYDESADAKSLANRKGGSHTLDENLAKYPSKQPN